MKLPPRHLIRAEISKRNFFTFLQEFWDTIIPDEPVYNWHMEYLCDELEIVARRIFDRKPKEYDLVINIPPGTSKSTICTVMFPVWCWVNDPTMRFITTSYSSDLSLDLAVKSRNIINSDKFKLYYPHLELKQDQNNKSHFANNQGGSRVSTSVGGTITGKHAHCIIIDDPLNPQQSASDKERENANKWLKETLPTRKVDKKVTPEILIMQRLHEEDPTAQKTKKKNVKWICLPAEDSPRVKPEELRERYEYGLLDPLRMDRAVLSEFKVDLGSYGYAGQFDQAPAPDEGGMIKKDWFGRFTMTELMKDNPEPVWSFVADTAYTSKEKNDPSGFLCYCVHKNNLYIRNVANVRLEFPDLVKFASDWPFSNGYDRRSRYEVEPKASGKSLVQTLKRATGLNIIESTNPTKDKEARVRDIQPTLESGRVFLLDGSDWIDEFLTNVSQFPNAAHDEMVDCIVMAVNRITGHGKKRIRASR